MLDGGYGPIASAQLILENQLNNMNDHQMTTESAILIMETHS